MTRISLAITVQKHIGITAYPTQQPHRPPLPQLPFTPGKSFVRYEFVLGRQLTAAFAALDLPAMRAIEITAELSKGRASPFTQNKTVTPIVSPDISEYLVQHLYNI